MKIALVFIFCILFACIVLPFAQAYSVQYRLKIANTENTVYIPGNGTTSSKDWSSEYFFASAPHKYIASYNNTNILNALVSAYGQTHSLMVDGDGNEHSIGLNMSIYSSKALLVFTSGDWKNIEDDIQNVEKGHFFEFIQPSFSYGNGLYLPVKIILNLTKFDITGNETFRLGSFSLIATNKGITANRTVIDVKRM